MAAAAVRLSERIFDSVSEQNVLFIGAGEMIELCATHIDISVDPVCRMRLSCQAAVARIRHEGVEHRFCSLACVAAFAAAPNRYLSGVST